MDNDKDALLSAMYNSSDDEIDELSSKPDTRFDSLGKTKIVHVGAIKYELPSVEYVNKLEQMIVRQNNQIIELQRNMEKLQKNIIATKSIAKRHISSINEMQSELDKKVNLRD